MPLTFARLVGCLERMQATPGRIDKQRALAALLRDAGAEDQALCDCVRMVTGRVFDACDPRRLGVSGATLAKAVCRVLSRPYADIRPLVIERGDLGAAVGELWDCPAPRSPPLTLADLRLAFDTLAEAASAAKVDGLTDLYRRCADGSEGKWLTRVVLGDLRVGAADGLVESAIAEAFDRPPERLRRARHLAGELSQVVVPARDDALEQVVVRPGRPLACMLAEPAASAEQVFARQWHDLPADQQTLVEPKLDGIRAQAHRFGQKLAIFSRTLEPIDQSFPDILQQLTHIPGDWVIDGEIVAHDGRRVLPFATLQQRLNRRRLSAGILRSAPARLVAFDLLWIEGRMLIDMPLEHRRAQLERLADASGGRLLLTNCTAVTGVEAIVRQFEIATVQGFEGLILKRPASPYTPGRRATAWLKLKSRLPTLDCVIVAAEVGHGKRRGKLSDYTFALWDRQPDQAGACLLPVGKAYSGLSDAEIVELTDRLRQLAVAGDGRRFEVSPEIVLEIAFDAINPSTRHACGLALRFPRIVRVRADKRPTDADTVERARALLRHSTPAKPSVRDRQLPLFDPPPSDVPPDRLVDI